MMSMEGMDATGLALDAGGVDGLVAKFIPPPTSAADQITKIVQDFEAGVAAGSITASGYGDSAGRRLMAFRNKLLPAKVVVLRGGTAGACGQLKELYQKMDGASPRFVEGAGVAAIAADVVDLLTTLGC